MEKIISGLTGEIESAGCKRKEVMAGAGTVAGLPCLPGFDMESALERLADNTRLYAKTLCLFVGLAPRHVKELEQALEQRDLHNLHRGVHTIKGLAATIGAYELHSESTSFERLLKAGQVSPEGLLQGVSRVTSLLDTLSETIRASGICTEYGFTDLLAGPPEESDF